MRTYIIFFAVFICSVLMIVESNKAFGALTWHEQYRTDYEMVFWGISAYDHNNIWAAGNKQEEGEIHYFNGSSWHRQFSDYLWWPEAVEAYNLQNVWVVGGGTESDKRYYYNGITWVEQSWVVGSGAEDISAVDESHVWATGHRYITFWNGSQWSEQHCVEDDSLGGIDALDANNVWAVGENGNNYFFHGTSWHKLDDNFTSGTFYSTGISVLDSDSIWVCGNTEANSHGKIFYFDGIEWIEQFSTDGYHIQAISAYDNEHVWAVGGEGKIYFYNGSSWSVQADFGSDITFIDVDVVTDKIVWTAGSRAVDVDQFPYFELRGVIYTTIPEPASFLIVFISLAGLLILKRKFLGAK